MPPGPTIVTRRWRDSRETSAATAVSRPIIRVTASGRLCIVGGAVVGGARRRSAALGGANSDAMHGPRNGDLHLGRRVTRALAQTWCRALLGITRRRAGGPGADRDLLGRTSGASPASAWCSALQSGR